jgi:hypothetical protein
MSTGTVLPQLQVRRYDDIGNDRGDCRNFLILKGINPRLTGVESAPSPIRQHNELRDARISVEKPLNFEPKQRTSTDSHRTDFFGCAYGLDFRAA